MKILGIETSCDETAAAVVDGERRILSSLVSSQIAQHRVFGGVVPEIAARSHLQAIEILIKAAMEEAKLSFGDLNGVAATAGPGLIGGLMVGVMAAKAISAARGIPFIAVNHLEGHALTPRLTDNIAFPYLLLLVSGGHTQLLAAEDVGVYKRWGTTLDDAAGECFDKSAKLMGLPYPGGPEIEKIARECLNSETALTRFPLPRPMKGRAGCDFSFSGLKTALRQHAEASAGGHLKRADAADLSFALQSAIADILAERCARAMTRFKNTYRPEKYSLVVSGGVAANGAIRASLESLCASEGFALHAPPLHLCSDNAAMIAWAGIERLRKNMTDPLDFRARPRWPLDPEAPARQGAGVKA